MNELLDRLRQNSYSNANEILRQICGVVNFFSSDEEKNAFISSYKFENNIIAEDRVSYGDWQTPYSLAKKVCEYHNLRFGVPDVVIEPTCGMGSFVLASIEIFPNLSEIHAIEINREYIKELKFRLLSKALREPAGTYPDIYIYNEDVFEFDFSPIIAKAKNKDKSLALIGNPPWVTNSVQGKNSSQNIPVKNNRYCLRGIEAITGKSNFDISEYITLHLLSLVKDLKGGISFLLKNSVIRNIISKQNITPIQISSIEQSNIDAFSEFQVSVSAACLTAEFSSSASKVCTIKDFYTREYIREFGWIENVFVADTKDYLLYSEFDGQSPYQWRSGLKHDCASVLELNKEGDTFINGLGEKVDIEDTLVYPLLKSSDIRHFQSGEPFRKYIIVPQHRIGEKTDQLKLIYPKVLAYLEKYESFFSKRKSNIYKNKDRFSIFGIGDYSFKPYKIVISSLYKTLDFKLVTPYEGKPIMLDDTCYQLDFDSFEEAKCIFKALTGNEARNLLESLVFKDAKRVITKNLLMRLDLYKLCKIKGITLPSEKPKLSGARQLSLFD